jgi:hypothetical protein
MADADAFCEAVIKVAASNTTTARIPKTVAGVLSTSIFYR